MSFTVSDDGKWIGFRGGSTKRYERNITQEGLYSDLYLLETRDAARSSGSPSNVEVGECGAELLAGRPLGRLQRARQHAALQR